MGVALFRRSDAELEVSAEAEQSPRAIIWRAVLISLSNPKAMISYGAVFSQFISTDAALPGQLVVLVPTAVAIVAIIYVGYSALGLGVNSCSARRRAGAGSIVGSVGSTFSPGRRWPRRRRKRCARRGDRRRGKREDGERAMLNEALIEFVDEWRLGHIATIGPEGPNVSPKGTFQALDASRLAFAEIRSPQTLENIAADPRVEVNMVDVFARKGARFRGRATSHALDDLTAKALTPRWRDVFGEALAARFKGFVVIELTSVKPLVTPAYDIGATERDLRADYLKRFTAMQEAALNG